MLARNLQLQLLLSPVEPFLLLLLAEELLEDLLVGSVLPDDGGEALQT